jgi:hypothetical protein
VFVRIPPANDSREFCFKPEYTMPKSAKHKETSYISRILRRQPSNLHRCPSSAGSSGSSTMESLNMLLLVHSVRYIYICFLRRGAKFNLNCAGKSPLVRGTWLTSCGKEPQFITHILLVSKTEILCYCLSWTALSTPAAAEEKSIDLSAQCVTHSVGSVVLIVLSRQ